MSIASMSIHSNSETRSAPHVSELEKSEARIKTLQAEKRKLEQANTKEKLLSSRLEQKLSLLENDLVAKGDELNVYKEQLNICETNLYETKLRNKDEINKLRDKREMSEALEATIIKQNNRCEELEERCSKLEEENASFASSNKVLQEENDKLHARVTEHSDVMYSRDLAREETRRKIADLSKDIQKLKFDLEDAQTENTTLKAKQRDYEEALIKSDGSLNYTRECAEEEAETANRKIAELNHLVRDLEQERRQLEISLTSAEDSHAHADREVMKRERMRRNLQSKLSHLISMLHATLPGIKVSVPRIKLMMNDEGESTDVEYSDNTIRSASPRRCLSPHNEEETIDVESVRLAILNLKKQTMIHENECSDLKKDLKCAQEQLQDSERDAGKLSRDNKALSEKIQVVEKEKTTYRDQVDSARGSIQTLEESRRELQKQLDSLEQRYNETTLQNQRLDKECTILKNRLEEKEEEMAEVKKMRDTANSEVDAIHARFDTLKKLKDQIESEKQSLGRQLKDMSEENASLEVRLNNLHVTFEESEKEKAELQHNISKVQNYSAVIQEKLAALENTLAGHEKKLKAYKEEKELLKQKLSAASADCTTLQRDKDVTEEKYNSLSAQCKGTSHKLADQQEKISKLQTAATENEMARIKVEGQLRSANLALQQKSSELRALQNKTDLLATENKHLQGTVSSLTSKVNQADREKRDLNEQVLSHQTEKKLNLQSRTSLEKQLASLQDALKNREESNRSYETKLNTSEMALERSRRELKKLEAMLGDTEEGSKSRTTRLEDMYKLELEKEHRLGRDKDKVIQTEHERNEELRRRISELQDQISTLNVSLHRQEATKKSYQDRIENKTAENKDLRSLLNETYSLQEDEILPSSTRLSYLDSPERIARSPDIARSRSPEHRPVSPYRRSTSPARRVSPARRRISSPIRHRSPSPTRTWRYTPTKESTYRVPGISDEVQNDLSNITELSEEFPPAAPFNKEPGSKSREELSANGKSANLTAGTEKSLKCLRCKSPIGLTVD